MSAKFCPMMFGMPWSSRRIVASSRPPDASPPCSVGAGAAPAGAARTTNRRIAIPAQIDASAMTRVNDGPRVRLPYPIPRWSLSTEFRRCAGGSSGSAGEGLARPGHQHVADPLPAGGPDRLVDELAIVVVGEQLVGLVPLHPAQLVDLIAGSELAV